MTFICWNGNSGEKQATREQTSLAFKEIARMRISMVWTSHHIVMLLFVAVQEQKAHISRDASREEPKNHLEINKRKDPTASYTAYFLLLYLPPTNSPSPPPPLPTNPSTVAGMTSLGTPVNPAVEPLVARVSAGGHLLVAGRLELRSAAGAAPPAGAGTGAARARVAHQLTAVVAAREGPAAHLTQTAAGQKQRGAVRRQYTTTPG